MFPISAVAASVLSPPVPVGQLAIPIAAVCLAVALLCLKRALAPIGPIVRAVAAAAILALALVIALVLLIAAMFQGALA